MTFLGSLLDGARSIGHKVASGIHSVGSKISKAGHSALDFIQNIPGLDAIPAVGTAKAILGGVDAATGLSGLVKNAFDDFTPQNVGKVIEGGKEAAAKISSVLKKKR